MKKFLIGFAISCAVFIKTDYFTRNKFFSICSCTTWSIFSKVASAEKREKGIDMSKAVVKIRKFIL